MNTYICTGICQCSTEKQKTQGEQSLLLIIYHRYQQQSECEWGTTSTLSHIIYQSFYFSENDYLRDKSAFIIPIVNSARYMYLFNPDDKKCSIIIVPTQNNPMLNNVSDIQRKLALGPIFCSTVQVN